MRYVSGGCDGDVFMIAKVFCETCSKKQGKRVVRDVPLFPLYCACGTVYHSETDTGNDPRWVQGSPCANRGESTRTTDCKACRGTVKLKVFECSVHDECTIKKRAGLQVCLGCDDWQPIASP